MVRFHRDISETLQSSRDAETALLPRNRISLDQLHLIQSVQRPTLIAHPAFATIDPCG